MMSLHSPMESILVGQLKRPELPRPSRGMLQITLGALGLSQFFVGLLRLDPNGLEGALHSHCPYVVLCPKRTKEPYSHRLVVA